MAMVGASSADLSSDGLLTVEELAAAAGLTVRTTRYYASLGLLPPPVRRGRMAYYAPVHLARLQLVRALQDHGFTLAAIERYLAGVPLEATPQDLAVQRALLTAWRPSRWQEVTREELEQRVGHPLSDADLAWLTRAGAVRRGPGGWQALPHVELAAELREVGVPLEAIAEANAAVTRHMAELADELTGILRDQVLQKYRHEGLSAAEAEELERTLGHLRTLTLEAIVEQFQRAADHVARRSLTLPR